MEESMDEEQRMMGESVSEAMQIDPKRARFPCSIVWSPLPFISWFIPFIGHIGICREDGVILDFAGPNYVCVDNFSFGAATRYIQINKEKQCRYKQDGSGRDIHSWDEALLKSTQEFQHQNYNLLTCNCHSFVASNLNKLGFQSGGWNVVNVAVHMFVNGRWVNKAAIVKSYVPFVVVFSLGVLVGGWTFLTFLVFFTSVLVGWYLVGTYCFKNLIQL